MAQLKIVINIFSDTLGFLGLEIGLTSWHNFMVNLIFAYQHPLLGTAVDATP